MFESKMLIGCYLNQIDPSILKADNLQEVREYLEDVEGFAFMSDCCFIGIEMDVELDLSIVSTLHLLKEAKYFKELTGVTAKLTSCINCIQT